MALLAVLFTGIALMGMGGEKNDRYSNKLMTARVWLQGGILLVLLMIFATGKS